MLLSQQSLQQPHHSLSCNNGNKKMKPRAMDEDTHNMIFMAEQLGPRHLAPEHSDEDLLSSEAIDGILDLLKCPICLEVFD